MGRQLLEVQTRHKDRFAHACEQWDCGEDRSAFRLFLLGAKAGDTSSQLNVGYFYDEGIGVRANDAKAMFWYPRQFDLDHTIREQQLPL